MSPAPALILKAPGVISLVDWTNFAVDQGLRFVPSLSGAFVYQSAQLSVSVSVDRLIITTLDDGQADEARRLAAAVAERWPGTTINLA